MKRESREIENYKYYYKKIESIFNIKNINLTIEGKEMEEELYRVLELIKDNKNYLNKEEYKLLSSRDNFNVLVKDKRIYIINNEEIYIDKSIEELLEYKEEINTNKIIRRVRGTKDIYHKEFNVIEDIRRKSKDILEISGYEGIDTPILESPDLYERNIGEYTDIVTKEIYKFKDRGGRDLCLRPEGTLGVLRAIIQNNLYTSKDIVNKYWYMGKTYRYETPQRGRGREFNQLGVECIGSDDIRLDIEVIRSAISILKSLGIENITLEINNIGSNIDRLRFNRKLSEVLEKYKKGFDIETRTRYNKNPLRILDSKDKYIISIIDDLPTIDEYINTVSRDRFDRLKSVLKDIGVEYTVNPRLIRGIDYYTDTVFEIFYKKKTLCGGGRYNNLIKDLGGPDLPGIGWAMGVERIVSIISEKYSSEEKEPIIIISIGKIEESKSLYISDLLNKNGIKNKIDYTKGRLKNKLGILNKAGFNYLILIGSEDISRGTIKIKSLKRGEQINVNEESFIEELKNFINKDN